MLGVAPDAGTDEIRSAYRARARALHPDRRGDPDPVADVEMAAVNEAWGVLGDPRRRSAYDRRLSGLAPGGLDSEAATQAPGSPGASRRAPGDPPARHEPGPGCLGAVAGAGPWIAVLVVLAAIFVFTAYANTGDDADPATETDDQPMVRVRDLRGSCVGLANGATIVVDCFTVPNEGVIVAQASTGAECPDRTVAWPIRQQGVVACTEPGTERRRP